MILRCEYVNSGRSCPLCEHMIEASEDCYTPQEKSNVWKDCHLNFVGSGVEEILLCKYCDANSTTNIGTDAISMLLEVVLQWMLLALLTKFLMFFLSAAIRPTVPKISKFQFENWKLSAVNVVFMLHESVCTPHQIFLEYVFTVELHFENLKFCGPSQPDHKKLSGQITGTFLLCCTGALNAPNNLCAKKNRESNWAKFWMYTPFFVFWWK